MDNDMSCKQCPEGTTCVDGSTLATLQLEPGHFRFNRDSIQIYECKGKNRNCDGGKHVETQCAAASKGPLCAKCDPGHTMVYTGRCEACGDAQTSKFFETGGWLVIVFFTFIAGFLYTRDKCTEGTARRYMGARGWSCIKAAREQDTAQLAARLKIVWTCYQIISATAWTLPDVVFPSIVEKVIEWISLLTVFQIDVNVPVNCINPNYNYYHNVVATNLAGPVVVGLFAVLPRDPD